MPLSLPPEQTAAGGGFEGGTLAPGSTNWTDTGTDTALHFNANPGKAESWDQTAQRTELGERWVRWKASREGFMEEEAFVLSGWEVGVAPRE